MGGQAAHSPHKNIKTDQSPAAEGRGHTAATSSPHGAAQGFLKATGLLVQGPVGKPNTDAVCSRAPEHRWERENKPLSGPEKKSRESKHRNGKDHPPDCAYLSETNNADFQGPFLKEQTGLNTWLKAPCARGFVGR